MKREDALEPANRPRSLESHDRFRRMKMAIPRRPYRLVVSGKEALAGPLRLFYRPVRVCGVDPPLSAVILGGTLKGGPFSRL